MARIAFLDRSSYEVQYFIMALQEQGHDVVFMEIMSRGGSREVLTRLFELHKSKHFDVVIVEPVYSLLGDKGVPTVEDLCTLGTLALPVIMLTTVSSSILLTTAGLTLQFTRIGKMELLEYVVERIASVIS